MRISISHINPRVCLKSPFFLFNIYKLYISQYDYKPALTIIKDQPTVSLYHQVRNISKIHKEKLKRPRVSVDKAKTTLLTTGTTKTTESVLKFTKSHHSILFSQKPKGKVRFNKKLILARTNRIKLKARLFLQKKKRFFNAGQFIRGYDVLKTTQPEKFCQVVINKTKNNTHCIVNSLFGPSKTLWSTSGGVYCNKINGRRKTRYVQRMVYKNIIDKILALGLQFLIIHCKGTFISKRFIFKTFSKNLKVLLIKDITGTAHNGCRPPKIRRV
jgi:ribosomal protein S11